MDEDTFDPWWREGVCAEIGAELFFVGTGQSTTEAKAACGRCPVRSKCLADAVYGEIPYGVFGGLTPPERKELWPYVRAGSDPHDVALHAIRRERHGAA